MGATTANLYRFGPNPYNPNNGAAKIWYWLDSDRETSIYIVDMSGKLVWKKSYASGSNGGKAGENNVEFDGRRTNGEVVGDGAYIFKVIQGGKVAGGGKIAVIR